MKILDLVVTKKWFNMTKSGEKPEEYREIKDYWIKRICGVMRNMPIDGKPHLCDFGCYCLKSNCIPKIPTDITKVRLHCGYTNITIVKDVDYISIGKGNPAWGAPDHETFIIHYSPSPLPHVHGGGK